MRNVVRQGSLSIFQRSQRLRRDIVESVEGGRWRVVIEGCDGSRGPARPRIRKADEWQYLGTMSPFLPS